MSSGRKSWRKCAQWLIQCGVLRQDHKANWAEATVADLAYTLRDGVILCNLLNILDPGCIKMEQVNLKPQMSQFLCIRNINLFLETCSDNFGLQDLFEPSMLFEFTDFYQVLSTLSQLSKCSKVQKLNILGFDMSKHRSSREDMFRSLNSNGEDSTSYSAFGEEDYCRYYSNIHNEEIYQDLCSVKEQQAGSQVASVNTQHFEKRDYVINELVETEKNYVDVLSTLIKCFINPLNHLCKEEDIKIVFNRVKDFEEIHKDFHGMLRRMFTSGNTAQLSEIILSWKDKFLIYGEYCAKLESAQKRIQEICRTNSIVDQEVTRCQEVANKGKFTLCDVLSVPMQRILKYHILLEKLISETQPNHEDYQGLLQAKEAMVDVAEYINDEKRDSEMLQILKSIQNNISGWCLPENTELKDYGRLLQDGELKIKSHDVQKSKIRYVFVFDQVLLMCKPKGTAQYCFTESLSLSQYTIDDRHGAASKDAVTWWYLVKKSKSTAYTMQARTVESKQKWINALLDAFDNIGPRASKKTDHKFVMHTFDKPTECNHCNKLLKGLIYQGYRCIRCSTAVHKSCIAQTDRCALPVLPPRPFPSNPLRISRPWTKCALNEYLWFVGEMERDTATKTLESDPEGTYLLRIRPNGPTHPNESVFALTLKTSGRVKHMKVYEKDIEGVTQYYLSESRYFKSIVDLIRHFEHTSLVESFDGLDMKLVWPFRRVIAVAKFDFEPTEPNQVPLKKGCLVTVISKEGDDRGWWKGKVKDRIGFFPKGYVRQVMERFYLETGQHQ